MPTKNPQTDKSEKIKELRTIPSVGKVVAEDLWQLGIHTVSDLKGKDPQKLYDRHNKIRGSVQDRCMLYTFRCAVYFADISPAKRDKKKLDWWYWKD